MPLGIERRVLEIIAQKGKETIYDEIREELMFDYGPKSIRRIIASLGRQDYINWYASGKIELTDKGKKALGLPLKERKFILTDEFGF